MGRELVVRILEDLIIRLVCFPSIRTYGATRVDANGDYNIYIDERLSDEMRFITLKHELTHIRKNHFNDSKTVEEAEYESKSKITKSPHGARPSNRGGQKKPR